MFVRQKFISISMHIRTKNNLTYFKFVIKRKPQTKVDSAAVRASDLAGVDSQTFNQPHLEDRKSSSQSHANGGHVNH